MTGDYLRGPLRARPAGALIQGYFCALHPLPLREKRLETGKFQFAADGTLEMRCPRCGDYWPLDTEFFYASKTRDGHFSWCVACYCEHRWPERYGIQEAA